MLEKESGFNVFIAWSGEKFDGAEFEDKNADDTEGVITQCGLVLRATSVGLVKQMPSGMKQKERVVLKAKVLQVSLLTSELGGQSYT